MWGIFRPFWCCCHRLLIVQSRPLTRGEIDLVRFVFGEALQVEKIRIVAHRAILKHYAMSPNGYIYFNPADWCEDFSQLSVAKQSWLIHELAHVWQIQQGIAVVKKALLNRQYHYVFQQGKLFWDYGVEQQAQMIQDYFLRKIQRQDCRQYRQCIPFLKA